MNDNLPPCEVEELIIQSFSFDNLKKYIQYIDGNSMRAFSQINEIKLKLLEIDEIKANVNEINSRLDNFSNKFEEIESALNFQQMKILDVEAKTQGHEERIIIVENSCNEMSKTLNAVEENIKNLNKVTEENCRSIDKLNTSCENLRLLTEAHSNKLETHEKNLSLLNSEIVKISGIETNLNNHVTKTKHKFTKIKSRHLEYSNAVNNKISEIDVNINKLANTLSDISSKVLTSSSDDFLKNTNTNIKKKDDLLITGSIPDVNDNFYKDYSEFRKKTEEELNSLNNKFKLLKKNVSNDSERNDKQTNDNNFNIVNPNIGNDAIKTIDLSLLNNPNSPQNHQFIISFINQLQENDKLILQNLTHKVNRDEIEKLQRQMASEIDKAMNKVTDVFLKNDEKHKKATESVISQQIDKNEIKNILQDVGKDIFSEEIGKIILEHIEKNEALKSVFIKTEANSEEINKIYESILEIRRITIDEKNNPSVSDKDKKEIQQKLEELESFFKLLKGQFDENIKGSDNGDNQDELDKESQPTSMRDFLRQVAGNVKLLGDKIEKIQSKQENQNSEILGKMKKDLGAESNRMLEEFRGDLKNSIGKIEDQLREKVDRMNLDEFGRKFDHKLVNEISKKIDKTDLKKNNTYFNKKIDHLENKISKTLVDTLIDLQMEEAPLIVKKSIMGDKCGSCNQVVLNNTNPSSFGNYHINVPTNNSANFGMNFNNGMNINMNMNSDENARYKLRTIQDNSNKYGTGSYSRILSNVNPETLNEELKPGLKNQMNSTNLQLPGINRNGNDKKKLNEVTPTRFRNKGNESRNTVSNNLTMNNNNSNYNNANIAHTHDSDKIIGSIINEELEKKYVNPDNLIKASNKFAEGNVIGNNIKSLK